MPQDLRTATLLRSVSIGGETRHFEFRAEGVERFDFQAGQFISIVASKPDGREITRAYSIASPPRGHSSFDLCLNRVQDGFMSNLLCDLPDGAQVGWHGPHGLFTLRQPLRDSIFVATGTGVAPFRSMLQWLLADPQRHQDRRFWLVYGTRHPQTIYYREEFEALARSHPNFRYLVTLSRGGEEWKGLRGYVQEHVRPLAEGRQDLHAYICGLNLMVSSVRQRLKELGWDRKSVIYERYD